MNTWLRKSSQIVAVAAISLMVSQCGPKPPNKGYTDNVPDEIQNLINKQYKASVYAIGKGDGPSEQAAVNKATMQARAEIALQFKAQIDVLRKSYEETVNDKGVDEYKGTIENFASLELSGSEVAKTMVRQDKGSYAAKVLVVVSAEKMKSVLDEKMQSYTAYKATKAYKELEDRVASEKQATTKEGGKE